MTREEFLSGVPDRIEHKVGGKGEQTLKAQK